MNIDLKGYNREYYSWLEGSLDTVKDTIQTAARACHVEVTTLIVPGRNDKDTEMQRLARWLASVDDRIPLHVTRFFPRYKMADAAETPVETVHHLANIASSELQYVYTGNC
jgi:Pyruvate-formate lyase-activating enzyme